MTKAFYLFSILLISNYQIKAQTTKESLNDTIFQIISSKNATVGVSIIDKESNEIIAVNSNKQFPLQSVFKFHIALAMLSEIDKGSFSLRQKINIKSDELLPNLWSPLREEKPNGGTFCISKLIEYIIVLSDNVACDVLLKKLGGPFFVESYIKNNNIQDISIKINEEQMQANWDMMFKNWTTPSAASKTLQVFFDKKNQILSDKSYKFIWNTMKKTQTGKNRIKGLLPKGTVVAHKTGTSGTNDTGIKGAVNDIGIIFLPNGNYFFISVFVTNSKESEANNEKIIADVARASWNYFISK